MVVGPELQIRAAAAALGGGTYWWRGGTVSAGGAGRQAGIRSGRGGGGGQQASAERWAVRAAARERCRCRCRCSYVRAGPRTRCWRRLWISECALGLSHRRSHALEPRVGQSALSRSTGPLPYALAFGAVKQRYRRGTAWGERGALRMLESALQCSLAQRTAGTLTGHARAAVPFDGGIGGEMTRFNAAAPSKRWPIHSCTHASRPSGGLDNPCLRQAPSGALVM